MCYKANRALRYKKNTYRRDMKMPLKAPFVFFHKNINAYKATRAAHETSLTSVADFPFSFKKRRKHARAT